MQYFTKDFISFFKELEKNNHRDWFQANKKRYEESVKKPFAAFVGEVIQAMHKDEKDLNVEAKDCIFRINRDIRFSKDKTPYKTNVSAIISPKARKDKGYPGYYMELSHKVARFYGGCYMPEKQNLMDIRYEMANDPKAVKKLINKKDFVDVFGEVQGEKNKIIPKDLREPAEELDLIYNKGFYYFHEDKPSLIHSQVLMDKFLHYYKAARPLVDYFVRAGGYAD